MVDSSAECEKAVEEKPEEPVLTRLLSSDGLATSKIETWQLNQFEQFDLNKPEETAEVSEALYRQVKQEIEPELKQQAELLKKEAYDLAYQKGYQEGFSEGSEKGRSEAKELALQAHKEALTEKLTELDALLSIFKQPYEQLENQVFSELTDLALHVAYQVTQKEISVDKTWVLEAVQEAVNTLPDDSKDFLIELSSEDLSLLQSLDHPMVAQWNLKLNASLAQGVCVVKQGNSSVLNSWKARFDGLSNQILTRTPSSQNPS
ncbi:hypothetical protein MNBD_GAMMA04-1540 [hydrothermal vent metagenome]|uniref:Flagellar assembly protein FliH/Type III secretion system HrpE domain-containing protein n=1 Tax=hydrothermal vent metagenome TaxID=652676 RepID=A0A3B0VZQ8_9ZZZZ